MFNIKIVSGLEKPFTDEKIENFGSINRISGMRGERISLQILYSFIPDDNDDIYRNGAVRDRFNVILSGALSKYAVLHQIKSVSVYKPEIEERNDKGLLRNTPGLYPDVILPMTTDGAVRPNAYSLEALLLDIEVPENDADILGESVLSVDFFSPKFNKSMASASVSIEIIDTALPKQKLIYTQWFHYDSLAHYYDTPMWSERHFEIVENFARIATKNGINMILTPVFTPPLDTLRGGERLTAQLVRVNKDNGEYSFEYSLLDRFIDMCDRVGIEYFEISHLFTQGGAEFAPKVMGYENGEYKRLFGWETSSRDPEYHKFLRAFLKDFINHMKSRGDDKRCSFHVSDEPRGDHIENYKQAMATVKECLPGYRIMDAMSDFEFYSEGILGTPVVSFGALKPFIDAKVPNLWGYYAGHSLYTGQVIAAPGSRHRSIGMQLYTLGIVGFLHWGFNFYNNCDSLYPINPYLEASGEGWLPAGDPFSVYPAQNGDCLESLRLIAFKAGIDDMRALKLCESLYDRNTVLGVIKESLGYSVGYESYVKTSKELIAVREKINELIKSKLSAKFK